MDTSNIRKKRRVWYAQLKVPAPLVDIVGCRSLSRSLKTSDVVEAARRKHAVLAEFHGIIDAARAVAGVEGNLSSHPVDKLMAQSRLLLKQVRDGGLSPADAQEEWGHWVDTLDNLPADAVTAEQAAAIRTAGAVINNPLSHTLLSNAIEEYLKDDPDRLRPSTVQQRKSRLEAFMQWRGECELKDITKLQVHEYINKMLRPRGISVTTIKHILGDHSTFMEWCCGRGFCEDNVFRGVARTVRQGTRGVRGKKDNKVRAWTESELKKLLTVRPANTDIWTMAILALYTGMRENEIAEVKLEDVHDNHIDVPEAKTESGIRFVPIHPALSELVAHLVETSTDGYLVSGLSRAGYDDKRHHNFSKRFSYHKRNKLKLPDNVVFHGLRHNFATAMVRARVPIHEIKQVFGHEQGSLLLDVYSEGVDLEHAKGNVSQVTFGSTIDKLVVNRITELKDQHPRDV